MEAIKPNGEWGQSSLLTHGNRASTQYPDTYTFNYTYTGRNQLKSVTNYATYDYDTRGNLTTRTLLANGRQSTTLTIVSIE